MRFQPPSYLTFCLSVSLVLFVAQGIDGRSASYTTVEAAAQKVESIPIPGMKAFPESITSTTDGTLYVGRVGDGGIVRVKPRTAESTIFIQPGASGSRSILGVFADQTSSTLWACSNDLSASPQCARCLVHTVGLFERLECIGGTCKGQRYRKRVEGF